MKKLLLIILAPIIISCSGRDRVCRGDYILKINNPTYLSCDPDRLTYEVKYKEWEVEIGDECECEYQMRLLEESWWEIVDLQPSNTHFMYNESPPTWTCEK